MDSLENQYVSQPPFTCSKLVIKTLEQGVKWRRSVVFIVNFEHISHLVLVFLLLTLNNAGSDTLSTNHRRLKCM